MTMEPAHACFQHFAPRPSHAHERPTDLDEPEGTRVDPDLPFLVDAHVHLFPDGVSHAIWRWFDRYAWPIRHKILAPDVIRFLLSRGVGHIVALHYAHVPGMARSMNRYVSEICKNEPRVTALATVLPGEPGAVEILEEAFAMGLAGVKLHCHVQCFSPDDPSLHEIYGVCVKHDKPLVMHAGRAPRVPAGLKVDPYLTCSADRVDRVLRDHPRLRLCVPHLGADEYEEYEELLERHENLWLDTTMMLADFFPSPASTRAVFARPERILFGTDFPILPYAWDRELKKVRAMKLGDAHLERLLGTNARTLYGIR